MYHSILYIMEIEIEIQPLLLEITRSERAIQEGIAQLRSAKTASSTKIQEESKGLDTQIEELFGKVKVRCFGVKKTQIFSFSRFSCS